MNNPNTIIILAGGKGKRMLSEIPKVLCKVGGKPMVVHILETVKKMDNINKIIVVVGQYRDMIKKEIGNYMDTNEITFVYQEHALGGGHAVQCCIPVLKEINDNSKIIILNGDSPLIRKETIQDLSNVTDKCGIIVTTLDNPYGLGRIITKEGNFVEIIEEKDADDETKHIKLVNSGMYCVRNDKLQYFLPQLDNKNGIGEYYITDVIGMVKAAGDDVSLYNISKDDQWQLQGANTPEQLALLEEYYAKHN